MNLSDSENKTLLNEVISAFFEQGSVDDGKKAMENAIKSPTDTKWDIKRVSPLGGFTIKNYKDYFGTLSDKGEFTKQTYGEIGETISEIINKLTEEGSNAKESIGVGSDDIPSVVEEKITESLDGDIADVFTSPEAILYKRCQKSKAALQETDGDKKPLCQAWVYTGGSVNSCKLKQCKRTVRDSVRHCWQHMDFQLDIDEFKNADEHDEPSIVTDTLSKVLADWSSLLHEAKQQFENQEIDKLSKLVDRICSKLQSNDTNMSEIDYLEEEARDLKAGITALMARLRTTFNSSDTATNMNSLIDKLEGCLNGNYE